ncbi:ATP-binding cassette domain-containing protein [Streptomycetaceae bacterium NBC_01309]
MKTPSRETPGPRTSGQPLLEVTGLTVEFRNRRNVLRAVDDVSLAVAPGETVGLVGESGSGKSTLGRAVLGLTPIGAGTVRFAGEDITRAKSARRRALSAELQVVFQDPYSSLNPARTIGQTLVEPLLVHRARDPRRNTSEVAAMLERVGLPAQAADRYPGQFSGGQRQRIAIARALMLSPRLVICDEPMSALDLSIQAQVMNLLADLQHELGLGYLFIAHDLPVVRHLSHRIVVLYRGRVMESGPADQVYDTPLHPYTRALLDAVPGSDPAEQRARRARREAAPAVTAPPSPRGCVFAHRCAHAIDICHTTRPPVQDAGARQVACLRAADLAPRHIELPVTAAAAADGRTVGRIPRA